MLGKTIKIIAVISSAFIFLTGCNSEKEVRERAFVQAAAVCENQDKSISVAVRIFEDEKTYTGTGKNFFEAVSDAQLKQKKHFFAGHMEFIISSAENNKNLLEEIMRENKISPSCTFIYSPDACETIKNIDCDEFYGIISIRSENGMAYKKSILTALKELTDNNSCETDGILESGEIFPVQLQS